MNDTSGQPEELPRPECLAELEDRKIWTSEELLAGQPEVLIVHGSETYRLRRTRQGKLILNK